MADEPDQLPERDPETVMLFVEESLEGLQRIEELLLEAERGRPAADLLATLFRNFHTIKGTSGFFAFTRIQSLSHAAEDLLSRLREDKSLAKTEHYSALLVASDRLRQLIDNVRSTTDEGDLEVAALVAKLEAASKDASVHEERVPALPPPAMEAAKSPPPERQFRRDLTPPPAAAAAPAPAPTARKEEAASPPPEPDGGAAAKGDVSDGTMRVNVAVLDRLMNLIGELVLARNQLVQMVRTSSDGSVTTEAAYQRLNLVTSELQAQMMKTRMQPVGRAFEKIPRMVRDLAKAMGKQLTTQIEGTSTEIDKALVEAVRDPVVHIVRNAIDHGIETPEERVAAGKPPIGRLTVRAAHEGEMVTIEVEDDGRGMNPKTLRAHAVKRHILSAADAAKLTDREALYLVFRPGFSTAERVTDISGRGVGMDVVRTHVERAGGKAELDSTVGKGTTIRLKMPLTLAIIPALMVRTGGQRFAIPQVSLLELVYLDEEQSKTAIEYVRGAAIYRLRGEILPVVRLASVLGLQPTATDGTNIIVLAVGARRYGLLVDAVQDTEEIVIKPLHSQFKRLGVYSGATVLGDGGIALILDVAGVALKGGIDLTAHREDGPGTEPVIEKRTQRQSMVVFLAGEGGQCAVPLSMVARLEQIPLGSIERAASSEVVQYHQGILPIVRPESVLSLGQRPGASEDQPLIVFDFGHAVGMAVNEILDIVEVEVERDPAQDKPFTLGTVVVFGRTTLVLDVYQIMRDLAPQFVTERRRSARPPRILLVDDSTAMRAALAGYLRSCGLKVVDVGSAPAALKELRGANEAAFDALITDLEMPDVDGFELLATVKRERPSLPCFAWTSHEEPEVIDRALAVGARACISKLKREELMEHFAKHGIGLRRGEDRRSA